MTTTLTQQEIDALRKHASLDRANTELETEKIHETRFIRRIDEDAMGKNVEDLKPADISLSDGDLAAFERPVQEVTGENDSTDIE